MEEGIIKKNMEQLFRMFPDSAVHVGDKWKLFSTEKNDINFVIKNFYVLKDINDGVADIESNGEIGADSASTKYMGYDVTSDLKGNQEGEYAIDKNTGMLISCAITAKIEGTIELQAREVKVNMKTRVKMDGQKLQ